MAQQTITIPEGLEIISRQLKGVRDRQIDDNRERISAIKARAVKLSTADLVKVLQVAQALADLPLGILKRSERSDVADVYTVFAAEWRDTRF